MLLMCLRVPGAEQLVLSCAQEKEAEVWLPEVRRDEEEREGCFPVGK